MNPEREKFFQELRKRLGSHSATSRYLQELQDHLDDAVEHAQMSGRSAKEAQGEAIRQLGPSNQLAESFHRAFSPHRFSFEVEAVLVSIFSVPFFIAGFWVMANRIIAEFTAGGITGMSALWAFTLTTTIFALLLFLYYFLALPRLFQGSIPKNLSLSIVGRLMAAPTIIFIWVLPGYLGSGPWDLWDVFMTSLGAFLLLSLAFITISGAWWLTVRRETRTVKYRLPFVTSVPILNAFSGILLIVYVMGSLVLIKTFDLEMDSVVNPTVLTTLIGARLIVDQIFHLVTMLIFGWFQTTFVWIIPLVFAAFLGFVIFSMVLAIRDHGISWVTFPWMRLALAVYLFTFFIGPANAPQIAWEVPALDVSQVIERAQLGPFYRFTKFVNRDEGRMFQYDLLTAEDGFEILQNTNRLIALSDIRSISSYSLHVQKTNQHILREDETFPEGFRCETDFRPENVPPDILEALVDHHCRTLYYHDQKIFTMDRSRNVEEILFSPDQQWALINLYSKGFYDPDVVYLVDLRSLMRSAGLISK
jgi:hypothetical protein